MLRVPLTIYGYAKSVTPVMVSQHRKHRGMRTQKLVADYLAQFWVGAVSAGAGRSGSDVLNVPFDVEVKARTAFSPKAWLDQSKARANGAKSIVVMRFNGQGENPEDYGVMMSLKDAVDLLRSAGFASTEIARCKGCGAWTVPNRVCSICSNIGRDL